MHSLAIAEHPTTLKGVEESLLSNIGDMQIVEERMLASFPRPIRTFLSFGSQSGRWTVLWLSYKESSVLLRVYLRCIYTKSHTRGAFKGCFINSSCIFFSLLEQNNSRICT